MADNWEWDTSDSEPGQAPKFRQFKKEELAPAGEKGLWAILDSVARQPSRPEPRYAPSEVEPPPLPATPPASGSYASGFLNNIGQKPVQPPPLPQSHWAPPPVEPPPPPPPPPVAPPPSPFAAPAAGAGGFGHLFRRQREESAPASQEGTSLKALFRRIS